MQLFIVYDSKQTYMGFHCLMMNKVILRVKKDNGTPLFKQKVHIPLFYIFFPVVRCPPLPIPTHGVKFGCFDNLSEPYDSRCGFSCNVGYNLFGTSVRRCLKNGTWSGETSSCQG